MNSLKFMFKEKERIHLRFFIKQEQKDQVNFNICIQKSYLPMF